jgi:hypothetical protein
LNPNSAVAPKGPNTGVFWSFSGSAPKVKMQNAIDITDLWR